MNTNYVTKDIYTCTDWHDMATDREQMQEKGKDTFEITDPLTFIAEDIYESLKNIIDEAYTADAIRKILEEKKSVTIKPVVEEMVQTGENSYTENPVGIQIDFEKDGSPFIMEDYNICYTYNVYYHIMEIEEGKVGFQKLIVVMDLPLSQKQEKSATMRTVLVSLAGKKQKSRKTSILESSITILVMSLTASVNMIRMHSWTNSRLCLWLTTGKTDIRNQSASKKKILHLHN